MKKSLSFLLSLVLLIVSLVLPAAGRAETMAEGMTPADTLALALQCAMTDGYEMDKSSVKQNGDAISAKAGIFTFTVEIRNGFAYSVSVACNYLDADYATAIGKIFGRMLKLLGGFTEIDSILTSIDFNVFNTLSPNTQTLIQGDYKVIVKVDPSSDNAYSLTLRLVNPVPEKSGASTVLSAGEMKLYEDETNASFGLLSYSASSAALTYSLALSEDGPTVVWYMTFADGEMQEARLLMR